MSPSRAAVSRGLQRIAATEGFVLAVDLRELDGSDQRDLNRGRQVLGCLSPWASAVILPASAISDDWLVDEAVPRSVGVIRPLEDDSARGACVGTDAYLSTPTTGTGPASAGPALLELAVDTGTMGADFRRSDAALVIVAGVAPSPQAWNHIDAEFDVPWVVAPGVRPFPKAAAHGRVAVMSGASGIVIGSELWDDLWPASSVAASDDANRDDANSDNANREDKTVSSGAADVTVTDEIRSRVATLVGVIRSAMGTWDVEGSAPSDGITWFGARSFIFHDDIDRYEERVVLIRADAEEAAFTAALAEADEYADAHGAVSLDIVQISPIRIDGAGRDDGLLEWQEVYSQFHQAASSAEFVARFAPPDQR